MDCECRYCGKTWLLFNRYSLSLTSLYVRCTFFSVVVVEFLMTLGSMGSNCLFLIHEFPSCGHKSLSSFDLVMVVLMYNLPKSGHYGKKEVHGGVKVVAKSMTLWVSDNICVWCTNMHRC